MVGEACLTSNAYFSQTPDYTLFLGSLPVGLNVLIRQSFMSLDYGLGTTTTTY